jgi:hypothetical protein
MDGEEIIVYLLARTLSGANHTKYLLSIQPYVTNVLLLTLDRREAKIVRRSLQASQYSYT